MFNLSDDSNRINKIRFFIRKTIGLILYTVSMIVVKKHLFCKKWMEANCKIKNLFEHATHTYNLYTQLRYYTL